MCAYMSSLGGVSGLASGVDWREIIDSLTAVEQRPIIALQQREATLNARLAAVRDVNSLALSLKSKAFALSLRANVMARSAEVSGAALTASASPDAAVGTHKITVYRLATATKAVSTASIGTAVDTSAALSESGMAVTPTSGYFTLDGTRITIDSSTTLDSGTNSITALINGAGLNIAASMELDSSGRYNLLKLYKAEGSIAMGSGDDTSNFLTAARLYGADPFSTWTSAVMEGGVEGTMAESVSSDARVTFSYGGVSYTTDAGALSATADTTTLSDFASALQDAINARIQGVGSVTVEVIDPTGTGNGKLVITDDRTGGSLQVDSLSGTVTTGLQPFLAASGATSGETVVSAYNLGTATAGNYLYAARLASTLKDSWMSGYVESGSAEGAVGFDLTGTETISFTYHGSTYVTGALASATAGVTSIADVAADLEAKMNAALGAAGSVSVEVYDPDGTGNARLVITDESPTGGSEVSFSFTSAPTGMALLGSEGAEAKGLMVINGKAVTYDKYYDTLNSLLSRINSSGAGVSASYDAVNDAVTLTAVQTGSASIYLEDVGGNLLESLNLSGEEAQFLGANARFSIDTVNGGQVMTSASNTVSGIILGVTLNLLRVSETDDKGSYVPSALTVTQDTSKTVEAVQDFIAAYNNLVSKLTEYTKYDVGTKSSGVLNGVSQARDLLRRLKSMVGYAAQGLGGYPMTLREIGISVGGSGASIEELLAGELVLEESALTSALADNPERVYRIMGAFTGSVSLQAGGSGSISSASGRPTSQSQAGTYRLVSDGSGNLEAYFTPVGEVEQYLGSGTINAGGSNSTLIPGVTLYAEATLAAGTDYLVKEENTTGVLKALELYIDGATGSGGVLPSAEDRMEAQIEDIQEQVKEMEERLEAYEARLIRQYTAMETLLSQMMSQSQWLSNQVSTLNRNWAGTR